MTGILLIDKPEGWTSHDVVAKLRRLTGERRIGHSGTLDPMATGLLVVFLGRATRAVEFAETHSKEYLARLRLGVITDTLDTTGNVLETREHSVTRAELEAVLPRFRGETEQTPPMYSAVKSGGRRLYEIARAGGEVERKPRKVYITALECTGEDGGDFLLDVRCSKGTYIRSLCADIGDALSCGGCMSGLRRISAGAFQVKDAHTLAEIEENGAERYLLGTDSVFSEYPALTVCAREEKKLRVGADFPCPAADGRYRVYSGRGEFLMLGQVSGNIMSTAKSFFEV